MKISAYIGFESRLPEAYAIAVRTLMETSSIEFPITPLLLPDLIAKKIYNRPMHMRDGQRYDEISDAPMSTEFSLSRFFVPYLAGFEGFSLFTDSDFLFRADIKELFDSIDPTKAVTVVKHNYAPPEKIKMDGQLQTLYERKNWSSMMVFNNEHPKNQVLTPDLLNDLTGRELHGFCWLDDEDIGEVGPEWNWLEGHSSHEIDPKIVHHTRGTPNVTGYEAVPYNEEWWGALNEINLCKKE